MVLTGDENDNEPVRRRTRTAGCVTCRKRHVKCDEGRPVCRRCRIGRRQCIYDLRLPEAPALRDHARRVPEAVSIPALESAFEKPWRRSSAGAFTGHAARQSLRSAQHREHALGYPSPIPYASESARRLSGSPHELPVGPDSPARTRHSQQPEESGPLMSTSPLSVSNAAHIASQSFQREPSDSAPSEEVTTPLSANRLTTGVADINTYGRRPTSNKEVYRLLQYYVEVVGPWLDLADSNRHFSRNVPEAAFQCPFLLHAILAFSAQQLHRLGSCNAVLADFYYHECLTSMIPMLQDLEVATDGKLLAATVILRMYEMLGPTGNDPQQHLIGSCALVELPSHNETDDGLRQAAVWIYLRQDTQMAERHRRQTILDLNNCFFRGFDTTCPTDDDMWANRMVWTHARVINYCFGPESERSMNGWESLSAEVDRWRRLVPSSFTPLYYDDHASEGGNPFPSIWLLGESQVLGLQSYHMARVLLNLHRPEVAFGGIEKYQFRRAQEAELIHDVRHVCGISVSNRCEAARIHASEQLAICGQVLETGRQRSDLLAVLRKIQDDTGWPTKKLVTSLSQYWDGLKVPAKP
ncbi:MAG: hypothetical protein M4579_004992 [Chaenotheca gracillima]|nr:MAG: hypothetical protein M4579_004992 [Chaenotheca gracillima]